MILPRLLFRIWTTSLQNIVPALHSEEFFNIAPNGDGFLDLSAYFGNPPNLEVLGNYPDVDSFNAKNKNIINTLLFHHVFFQTRKEHVPRFTTFVKTPPLFISESTSCSRLKFFKIILKDASTKVCIIFSSCFIFLSTIVHVFHTVLLKRKLSFLIIVF